MFSWFGSFIFDFMMIITMMRCLDISKGICGYLIYKLCFMTWGFWSIYKRNSAEFSIDFSMLEILMFMNLYRSIGIHFSNGFRYQYALRILERCSRNRGLLKGMRRLPHVRPSGRGVTILLVVELMVFKSFFRFL